MKPFQTFFTESKSGWIGVDLDSTLAYYSTWRGYSRIGKPIPAMVEKVKQALEAGKDVRIFTARADNGKAVVAIKKWCKKHLGVELPVTNVKDKHCKEIWDDRAKQVVKNKGEFINGSIETDTSDS